MLDATSLEALHATFPELPKAFEEAALVKMHSPRARRSRSAALQRAGYLGCFAIGERLGDEMVLRVFPDSPVSAAAVGEAPKKSIEGMTFSPDLRHWIAGRLVTIEAVAGRARLKATERKAIEAAASEFGGESAAASVLERIEALSDEADMFKRSAALWAAAGRKNPLFQSLALVWSSLAQPLQKAVNAKYPQLLEWPILPGVYVGLNSIYRSKVELDRAAWRVISGDAVFDFTYNGMNTRPGIDQWESTPWLPAVRALKGARVAASSREALALKAARAFAAKPTRYGGSAHLDAARKLAKQDPVSAFVHARNAAAFHARALRTAPRDAIRLAHTLADENGWSDLALLLAWAD